MDGLTVEQKKEIGILVHSQGYSSRAAEKVLNVGYKSIQRYVIKVTKGLPILKGRGRPTALTSDDLSELSDWIAMREDGNNLSRKLIKTKLRELYHKTWYERRFKLDEDIRSTEEPPKLSSRTEQRYIERAKSMMAIISVSDLQ